MAIHINYNKKNNSKENLHGKQTNAKMGSIKDRNGMDLTET